MQRLPFTPTSVPMIRDADWHASEVIGMQGIAINEPLATLGSMPFPDEPWWKRLSPSTVFVLGSVAVALCMLIGELWIARAPGFPIDEAWLHQVYARNFFQHITFDFTAGEHTPGPTAPFWTVVLAILQRIAHDPFIAAKLLGTFFLSLTGFYSFRTLRAARFDYGSAVLGGILAITVGRIAWATLSGMESTMSAALVIAAIWAYIARPQPAGRLQTGTLFALAVLARPEASLVFLIVLIERLFDRKNDPEHQHAARRAWKDIALMAFAFLLILLPIAATNIALSGEVLPQTFLAGMRRESLLVLLRHADFLLVIERCFQSTLTFRYAFGGIYVIDHPVFFIAIVAAAILYFTNDRVHHDPANRLFRLSLMALIGVPYLRALFLGMDGEFGEHARWVHFLSPIAIVAGLSAVRILIVHYALRGPTSKQIILTASGLMAGGGLLVLLLGNSLDLPVNHWANALTYPALQHVTPPGLAALLPLPLYFLPMVLVATLAAFRYCGINPFKRDIPLFVSEEEREVIHFTFLRDGDDDDEPLGDHVIRLMRGVLLIALAWNAMSLVRASAEFGEEVRLRNTAEGAMTKAVMERTQPDEAIASNEIGALGYSSERHIIDTEGNILIQSNRNQRMLGREAGLMETLAQTKAQYFAAFGTEYDHLITTRPQEFELLAITSQGQLPGALYRVHIGAK